MKTIWIMLLVLVCISKPALAVDGREARLIESSIPGVEPDSTGAFDLTQQTNLVFEVKGRPAIAIPYSKITQYASHTEVTHHLGVAGTIAVGLVKKRQRGHFLTITYRDEHDMPQIAAFEISKTMPNIMLSLLHAKAMNGREQSEPSR